MTLVMAADHVEYCGDRCHHGPLSRWRIEDPRCIRSGEQPLEFKKPLPLYGNSGCIGEDDQPLPA